MVKCAKCTKIVNKKNPGILCVKCNKWFHGTCAAITIEQLTALHQTEAAEWKCRSCAIGSGNGKPKRLSYIMPDPPEHEDENEDESESTDIFAQPSVIKFMDAMRREVRTIITDELQQSLKYFSDKIDDFELKINTYETKLKTIENKCMDTKNQHKNLLLHCEVLEQKYNTLLQEKWSNYLEICGIEEEGEVETIAKSIGTELKQNANDVITAYRKPTNKRAGQEEGATKHATPPVIVVSLKDGCREKWMTAAKSKLRSDAGFAFGNGNQKVYMRESLSPTTAYLLFKTKTELKTPVCISMSGAKTV